MFIVVHLYSYEKHIHMHKQPGSTLCVLKYDVCIYLSIAAHIILI